MTQVSATGENGYDSAEADLGVSLYATDGLIHVYEYYDDSTDASETVAGGVEGYFHRSGVKNGETGTTVWQTETDYVAKTVNGITRYFTYSSTQYADTAGTDASATTYSYTFHDAADVNGPAIHVRTTTLPVVSVDEHGSGTANSHSVAYDVYGRAVWTRDAAGYLSYTEYDADTGAVVTQIADIDTDETTDYDNTYLPGGWSTPTDGEST